MFIMTLVLRSMKGTALVHTASIKMGACEETVFEHIPYNHATIARGHRGAKATPFA